AAVHNHRLRCLPVADDDGRNVDQCAPPAHGAAMATASLQRVRGRRARCVAFLVAGRAGHTGTAALCSYFVRPAGLSVVQAPGRPQADTTGGESPCLRHEAPDLRGTWRPGKWPAIRRPGLPSVSAVPASVPSAVYQAPSALLWRTPGSPS